MDAGNAPQTAVERSSLRAFLLYFLRLGTLGFGGPIALAGHMEQDLVEQRGWISAQEYKEGLAFAQLAPGPLAAQLAIYLGWVRGQVLGATLVGIAFVAPSFLMVLVLSELYVRFGGLPWMQGLFYGIGAAVIAIIARSALKLVRMTLGRDPLLWILDRKSTRLNSSHGYISYAVFCLKKKKKNEHKYVATMTKLERKQTSHT